MHNIWFNHNDIRLRKNIESNNIQGYVLPHASTQYTGNIISHTLQFKPTKYFNKIYIIYYPSHDKPNIDDQYYHEYCQEYYHAYCHEHCHEHCHEYQHCHEHCHEY